MLYRVRYYSHIIVRIFIVKCYRYNKLWRNKGWDKGKSEYLVDLKRIYCYILL